MCAEFNSSAQLTDDIRKSVLKLTEEGREDTNGDIADPDVADGNLADDDVAEGNISPRNETLCDVIPDNVTLEDDASQEPECSTGSAIPSRVEVSKFTLIFKQLYSYIWLLGGVNPISSLV